MELILISLIFAFGFFFESIFGFGGSLISYSILGFLIDLKLAIKIGLYIGTLSSTHIVISGWRHFNSKIFLNLLPIAIVGSLIGSSIFSYLSPRNLSLFFGVLLLILSVKSLCFDHLKFPKIFKQKLLAIGALCQGTFGVGGPFVIQAIKADFVGKSELRTTMAAYFLFCNLIRFVNLGLNKQITFEFFTKIWWIILPVFLTIWLGHQVHLKINEKHFRIGISILTMIAGIRFILF